MPQRRLRLSERKQLDTPCHPHLKAGSGGIAERHPGFETHLPGIAADHRKGSVSSAAGTLPVGIDLLGARVQSRARKDRPQARARGVLRRRKG